MSKAPDLEAEISAFDAWIKATKCLVHWTRRDIAREAWLARARMIETHAPERPVNSQAIGAAITCLERALIMHPVLGPRKEWIEKARAFIAAVPVAVEWYDPAHDCAEHCAMCHAKAARERLAAWRGEPGAAAAGAAK